MPSSKPRNAVATNSGKSEEMLNHTVVCCREIVDYVNSKDGKPLGGDKVDQKLAAAWADKIHAWDGNLFVAGNGDPGERGASPALIERSSRSSGR